ncbi:MAG: PQQ-like beta-propeller repeat protein [Wolbachia endosymbiont of Fragariocoptes setiger]|nr:PQQ-like beta-propeller repeat protein [Wolbachia endosymbiont of Fragariocoptes setiger]
MRIIIIIILLLIHSSCCVIALPIDKKLSQGYVAPIIVNSNLIVANRNGSLFSLNAENLELLNWKSPYLYNKKVGSMHLTHYKNCILYSIDNILWALDARNGEVLWKRELQSPIKGKPVKFKNQLAVLTIDNYLYLLNFKNGDLVSSYYNGTNEIITLHSVSPVVVYDTLVVPFSNGELIAFDKNGKTLWSYKFSTNLIETQFSDIITTPRVIGNVLITANDTSIVALDVKSGTPLWSHLLKVKSLSNIGVLGQHNSIIVALDKNDRITALDAKNGEIVWSFNLKNSTFLAPIIHTGVLYLPNSKGSMTLFKELNDTFKTEITIPSGVFHSPLFVNDKIYITTEKNGVYLLK